MKKIYFWFSKGDSGKHKGSPFNFDLMMNDYRKKKRGKNNKNEKIRKNPSTRNRREKEKTKKRKKYID